jgi:RNA polymerase sigma factor (TIGR02999 family)
MAISADITELLNAANSGDAAAQDAAYALVYGELKKSAQRQRAAVPGSSLTPTALVHELFLRFNDQRMARIQNRVHFFSLAARAMRQIVVDHARRRASVKRGGDMEVVDFDKALDVGDRTCEEALDLDDALTHLGERAPDLVRLVEWHFFAGLTFKEIAAELGCHERTVFRDWELARSVLQESMRPTRQ